MDVICLHEKDAIEAALRGADPYLQLYALGDLDDFFWPHTVWYGRADHTNGSDGQRIADVVLLYTGFMPPVLHALAPEPAEGMRELLEACLPLLPRRFHAHLSPGLAPVLAQQYARSTHGTFFKMALHDSARLETVDTSGVEPMETADLPELQRLYTASYPDNSFDPRMLETGQYFGMRENGLLVCVAGVHVYSPRYRIAVVGNVTSHPEARGRGLATRACARLCRSLLEHVEHIGLNVHSANAAAIACYERLGFERVAVYEEWDAKSI